MSSVQAPAARDPNARHLAAPHFHLDVQRTVDVDAAERAVSNLLLALGLKAQSEDLRDTPRRVAAALAEMVTPKPFTMTTFDNEHGYDDMVIVRDVAFHSLCAHHLLPFFGVAHVAYVPNERIVGLSKLARVVEHFAGQPQTQERLTVQIADAIDSTLSPLGVGVALTATHLCVALRGARVPDAATLTTAMRGTFRDDAATRSEFLMLTGNG